MLIEHLLFVNDISKRDFGISRSADRLDPDDVFVDVTVKERVAGHDEK